MINISNIRKSYNEELYHFGIKGMKWGVRRYQNKDGTLTNAGKKRYSEQYKELITAANNEIRSNENKRYVDSYNKAADDMNNGLIDKYNAEYRKKLGKKAEGRTDADLLDDDEYMEGWGEIVSTQLQKYYNSALISEIENNPNYKKAKALCDQYKMTNFDDFAKENEAEIDEIRKLIG